MGEAKRRKKLDPTFGKGRRQGLSIDDYLSYPSITPELIDKYQVLIPKKLANDVYRFIDEGASQPDEEVNRLYGEFSYYLRLTMSYGPARRYISQVVNTPEVSQKDFLRLAGLILCASHFSELSLSTL